MERDACPTIAQIRARGYAVWTSPAASLDADVRARMVSSLEGLFRAGMLVPLTANGRIYGPRGDTFGWIQSAGPVVDTLEVAGAITADGPIASPGTPEGWGETWV